MAEAPRAHPADGNVALPATPGILLNALPHTVKVVNFAADVDFEAEVPREVLDRVVRAAPLARVRVEPFGEDQADVVPALFAELLLGDKSSRA